MSFFRLTEVTRREVFLVVASIADGILLVIGGLAWIGRSADDGKAEVERAIADLSAVPAPDGSSLQGLAANACRRDDLDGDTEPSGSADYRWQDLAPDISNLNDWYLPAWREQGWTDSGGDAGVLQRRYGEYTVRVHIQEWETPPGFSITATIAEPIC